MTLMTNDLNDPIVCVFDVQHWTEWWLPLFIGVMTAAFFVSVCVGCADSFPSVSPLKHLKKQQNRQIQAAIDLKSCLYFIEICAYSWEMHVEDTRNLSEIIKSLLKRCMPTTWRWGRFNWAHLRLAWKNTDG